MFYNPFICSFSVLVFLFLVLSLPLCFCPFLRFTLFLQGLTIETKTKGDDSLQILLTTINKLKRHSSELDTKIGEIQDRSKALETASSSSTTEEIEQKRSKRSISNTDLMSMFKEIMEALNKINEKS